MDIDEKRKKANRDLIERMRRNEPLNTVQPEATWYPPRPVIAKNKTDIERLYGKGVTAITASDTKTGDSSDDTIKTSKPDG